MKNFIFIVIYFQGPPSTSLSLTAAHAFNPSEVYISCASGCGGYQFVNSCSHQGSECGLTHSNQSLLLIVWLVSAH